MQHVFEAGGKESREPQDHGWMYGRSFQDIWPSLGNNIHGRKSVKKTIIIVKANSISLDSYY